MGKLHRPLDASTGRAEIIAELTGVLQDYSHSMPVDLAEIMYTTAMLPLLEKEYRRGAIAWQRAAADHLDAHEEVERETHGLRHAFARKVYHATVDAHWLRKNADEMEKDDDSHG